MSYNPHIPVTDGLVFGIVPALASLRDVSGAGRHPTVAGAGLKWVRRNGVYQILAESTGRLVVANDATLEAVTDFSLFASGEFQNDPSTRRFFQKRTHIEVLNFGGVAKLRLQTATTAADVDLGTWEGVESFCINAPSGAIPRIATNGVDFGPFDGVSAVSPDTGDIYILNQFNGGSPWLYPLKALLLYNRVIDADENARNHAWSRSLSSPSLPHDRRYWFTGSRVENGDAGGVVGAWDLGQVTGREVADKSGGGAHVTLNGKLLPVPTVVGGAVRCFDGVDAGAGGAISGDDDITVEALLLLRSAGAAGLGRLITLPNMVILFGGTPVSSTSWGLTGVTGSMFHATGAVQDQWMHLVYTRRRSDGAVRIYMNGEAIHSVTGGTEALAYSGNPVLFNDAATGGIRALDGDTQFLIVRNRYMEADEVKRRYAPIARKLMYELRLSQVPPTLANVTAGQEIPGTDFRVGSGVYAVLEDSADKWIECITTGQAQNHLSAVGLGGMLELRRDGTDWRTMRDAAQPTDLDLIAGDQLRIVQSTLKPIHQFQGYYTWTTDDTTQNWTINATAGQAYWINWGDGTLESFTGIGANQVIAHNYAAPGTYTIGFLVETDTTLVQFYCYTNSLTGSIPSLFANTALQYFDCSTNPLKGSIPDLSANIALIRFYCYGNSLTGPIPSLSANVALAHFYCSSNSLTGSIPDLSQNVALVDLRCNINLLTGYTAGVIAATCTTFRADYNALTLAAVDQILTDFTTGAGGRPGAGTIALGAGTNSAPTPAVLNAANAALPGWTITTN